jgi:hypothetical protein
MSASTYPLKANRWASLGLIILFVMMALLSAVPRHVLAADIVCARYHTVKSGDTLYALALTYKVEFADLVAANDLKDPYVIFIDQQLCIPASTTAVATTTPVGTTVAKGVTISVAHTEKGFTIQGSGLPRRANYIVKIDDASEVGLVYTILGKVATKSGTTFKNTFVLPKELRGITMMSICLKNQMTDELICVLSPRIVAGQ